MKNQRILCFKYNYSLDEGISDYPFCESYLSLSEDGEKILILNKKPNINNLFAGKADPYVIKEK